MKVAPHCKLVEGMIRIEFFNKQQTNNNKISLQSSVENRLAKTSNNLSDGDTNRH
jgi:hypothetical protein